MAGSHASQSSVGVGASSTEPTVLRILETTRNPEVWSHYDLCEMSNGEKKARCKGCGIFMVANSNSTLRNHTLKYCRVLKGASSSGAGQATMTNEGGIFNYDLAMVQDRMSKFVIQEALPFNHFDNPRLTRLIRETLQPRYQHVSRMTLKRHCLKLWKQAKNDLILFFENLQTGVNLTTDVWSAPHNLPESYLCVTAHWVEPNTWQMMKRTIAFEMFEYPHTGDNLFHILNYVVNTYHLENKILSISFDNASNNTLAVEKLKLLFKPIADGVFFHSRCVAHIINLIVQDGLGCDELNDFKESFRYMLREIFKKSRQRYAAYRKMCKDTNRICLGPNWDVPTRWNSTYNMFASALRQKESLKVFHGDLEARLKVLPFPDEAWNTIDLITDFLEVFKNATTILSGVYYPTSSLVLYQLYLMANKLYEYENKSPMFASMVRLMKLKFKKYFENIPPVFTCAAFLNPYLNVTGVETIIDEIDTCLNFSESNPNFSSDAKNSFKTSLHSMYEVYSDKYGGSNPIHESMASGSASSSSRRNPMINLYNTVRSQTAKRQRGNAPNSELGRYMGTDFVSSMPPEECDNFDILAWWKGKESQFPILSAMARDLLTVQASTVASESAFSLSGRVLSIRRTRLTPTSLEMCICLKDHLDAVDRIQDQTSLEDEVDIIEAPIHEQEVEDGLTTPLSDEEMAYDNAVRINSGSD